MALSASELEYSQRLRNRAANAENLDSRMDRMRSMLATEGGRYSPVTINRTRENLDFLESGGTQGLRAHEMAMLKQQGQNAIGVEKEKDLLFCW